MARTHYTTMLNCLIEVFNHVYTSTPLYVGVGLYKRPETCLEHPKYKTEKKYGFTLSHPPRAQ